MDASTGITRRQPSNEGREPMIPGPAPSRILAMESACRFSRFFRLFQPRNCRRAKPNPAATACWWVVEKMRCCWATFSRKEDVALRRSTMREVSGRRWSLTDSPVLASGITWRRFAFLPLCARELRQRFPKPRPLPTSPVRVAGSACLCRCRAIPPCLRQDPKWQRRFLPIPHR